MAHILAGLEGVLCHVDDILIHGRNQKEHDERLSTVLDRLEKAGITINEKCEFNKTSIKFLGHILDRSSICPDPSKTEALRNMPTPKNITELRRFLGMANQLSKFSKDLADESKPLRDLQSLKNLWV